VSVGYRVETSAYLQIVYEKLCVKNNMAMMRNFDFISLKFKGDYVDNVSG
jgi:hypothetical protein